MLKRIFSMGVFTLAIGIAHAQQSMATIDAIDPNTHIVRAHLDGTGQSVQFRVTNQALLTQLRPGQRVYVNLSVSLDGRSPAGTIVSLAAAPSNVSGGGPSVAGAPSAQPPSPSTAANPYLVQQAVQAAANMLTASGDVVVRPQCGGSVVISCSQGRPVVSDVRLTQNSLQVSPAGPNAYTFSALVAARTPADIPISSGGISCGLNIDTGRSAPFAATGTFNVANLPAPNSFKLTLTGVRVSNPQGAVRFNGGVGCGVANTMEGMVMNSVLPQLLQSRSTNPVCIAVDPRAGPKAVSCPR